MSRLVNFAYNPTSWRDGGPVDGGMADCLVRPVVEEFLPGFGWSITDDLMSDVVNVYYTFPSKYRTKNPSMEKAVFVSHGIADKAWREVRKVEQRFDFVFVSGPAWTRKMIAGGMYTSKIVEVGYAKLDPIFQRKVDGPGWSNDGRIKVVWAPTHGGGGEHALRTGVDPATPASRTTSWWHRDQILALLPDSEFEVIEAPHPRHRPDKRSTMSEYVGADVVIADGGSTIYEAWALDLPVVFPDWLTREGNLGRAPKVNTFEKTVYANRLGYHAGSANLLARTITLAHKEGIGGQEHAFVETIIPQRYRGCSGRLHAEALMDIAQSRAPRHRVLQASNVP